MRKNTAALLCLLGLLCLLSACRSGDIMQQLHSGTATTNGAPAIVSSTAAPVQTAPLGSAPAVGSTTAEGATVTGVSADGSRFYASSYTPAGTVVTEYTYATATGIALYRVDYGYDEAGALTSEDARALADKAFAYIGQTDGQTTACSRIYTEYSEGRETYVFYSDLNAREVALTLTSYAADGSYVRRFYEYGRLVYVHSYGADGTLLFSSETGAPEVGAEINLGGTVGKGTITAVGADGAITVKFTNQSHNMTDGTGYAGLDLYMQLNAEYRPILFYYASGDTKIAQYEVTYAPDRSYVQQYYEFGRLVCSLSYDSDEKLLSVTDAAGNAFNTDAGQPAVGQLLGEGLVCQVNPDGTFVVVYTNKTYKTLSGKTVEGTTLYAFYTAEKKLSGSKFYYGSENIAEYDLFYNADGSYKVNIFEGGSLAVTVEYDTAGKAIRMYDANGNVVA